MRDKLNDNSRLELMLESIVNIESFLPGIDSEERFLADKLKCHAVLYNLQCIGESVYRLSKDFQVAHNEMDWEAMEGLRHVLVHDYYNVNLSTVWAIIQTDLPVLKHFLQCILT